MNDGTTDVLIGDVHQERREGSNACTFSALAANCSANSSCYYSQNYTAPEAARSVFPSERNQTNDNFATAAQKQARPQSY